MFHIRIMQMRQSTSMQDSVEKGGCFGLDWFAFGLGILPKCPWSPHPIGVCRTANNGRQFETQV